MKNINPILDTLPYRNNPGLDRLCIFYGYFIMGYVYFFKHNNIQGVKIGMTTGKDVSSRFKSFKTYSPFGAKVLATIETSQPARLEKKLHDEFKHLRMRGEFFNLNESEVKTIIEDNGIDSIMNDKWHSLSLDKKERVLNFITSLSDGLSSKNANVWSTMENMTSKETDPRNKARILVNALINGKFFGTKAAISKFTGVSKQSIQYYQSKVLHSNSKR